MDKTDLYRKYKHTGIKPNILTQYIEEDRTINFNEEDPDLDTIPLELPEAPPWDTIDGFGLMPSEQMFIRQTIPQKIIELQEYQAEDGEFLTQEEIRDKIEEQPEYYAYEISWIKTQWKRMLSGYWFFNNGKVTYIDGWHYRYLNFYELDIGAPEYRDRDRRFFLFARMCKEDPYCYGFVYPKHRREGATFKTSCIHYDIITTTPNARGGIQSMTDTSAKDVFSKHIIDPWRRMPFFVKPNHNGGDDPKTLLSFRSSSSRGKVGIKKKSRESLDSEISFRSSMETAYDGTKLYFYHHEEVGKSFLVDINKRWEVSQLCLSTGAGGNIHGFSIHTSTVGEMEGQGGEQFRELCEGSMYGQRNDNGRTATGLYILFMPAWDGLEGYIDKYGMSVIDTPTEEQRLFLEENRQKRIGKFKNKFLEKIDTNIGAKQFIQNTIEGLKKLPKKNKLLQFQREHPTTFKGCFRSNPVDPFFNIGKIEDRLDELRNDRTVITRGDFEWIGEPYKSGVRFIPNEDGRFKMSKQLKQNEVNKVIWNDIDQTWIAENFKFCAGGDPFKANQTKGKRRSNGGGTVYWGHDIVADPYTKPLSEYESCRFVCSYSYRPETKEDYGDDMIKMCVYWGCPMYPETNVPFLREYFIEKGYGGMLVHRFHNGKYDAIAGADTGTKEKEKIWQLYQTQIERHCHREKHADILEEVGKIRSLEEMTFYDLFTAGGYAMLGIDNYLPEINRQMQQEQTQPQGANFFETYII